MGMAQSLLKQLLEWKWTQLKLAGRMS